MAKTRIDDLAQDTEELGAAEQKALKGGALPAGTVQIAAVGSATVPTGAAAMVPGMVAAAAMHTKRRPVPTMAGIPPEGNAMQQNPLFDEGAPRNKPGA